ncbi:MAG: YbaK/EbsC family protein [Malacoplasma sp.]|nr:YbaK/EbsC family protein [Malacoplasma sp.]
MSKTNNSVVKLLDKLNIKYDFYKHEPITCSQVIDDIRKKLNLKGVESKNLFLKTKSNRFFLLVTDISKKFNKDFFKDLLNEKVSFATFEELEKITGYKPNAAASFCYPKDIDIYVDNGIFDYELFSISTGNLDETIELKTESLKQIYKNVENKVIYLDYK